VSPRRSTWRVRSTATATLGGGKLIHHGLDHARSTLRNSVWLAKLTSRSVAELTYGAPRQKPNPDRITVADQVRQAPVALFLPTLQGGGAERVAINLAQGFIDLGIATDLVTVSGRGEFAGQVPSGVRLIDFDASRVILGVPALAAYLRRERPSAVIAFMDHACIAALMARRVSGVSTRIICTVHNTLTLATSNSANFRNRLLPMLLRAFYPSADGVVAVSHGVARDLSAATGLPLSRIKVIYNPVITDDLTAAGAGAPGHPWLSDGGPPVVLGVGRLTQQKNFSSLIRAFAAVRRKRPARLLILGEGEERPALEELVRKLELGSDVALPGFLAGAQACMAQAAVFVLSSAWEGLPTVLIEALAAGATVVSTDCPSGPREILRGGELGQLVPPGDVDALADGIMAALSGSGRRVPLSDLEEYTQQFAAKAYLRLVHNGGR
jgi:glycosyltransferase involved in cell wall biosynthesis